MRARLVMIND